MIDVFVSKDVHNAAILRLSSAAQISEKFFGSRLSSCLKKFVFLLLQFDDAAKEAKNLNSK